MNVAMYETDEFHQDCTLIGEDVLREAGIETTSAKREGPYTYKRTPKYSSHPYTLRSDIGAKKVSCTFQPGRPGTAF